MSFTAKDVARGTPGGSLACPAEDFRAEGQVEEGDQVPRGHGDLTVLQLIQTEIQRFELIIVLLK